MRKWFEDLDWEDICTINRRLCEKSRHQHGVSESQSPRAMAIWAKESTRPMTLETMVDVCRRLHEASPFFNFNGNTFAALAVEASQLIESIPPDQRFLLEDAIGQFVAGTGGKAAEERIKIVSAQLAKTIPPKEPTKSPGPEMEI